MKSSRIKLRNFIIVSIYLLIAIYNSVYVIGHEINSKFNIKINGKQAILVKEKSMEPAIKKNTIITLDKKAKIDKDDIIAFYKNNKIVLRRVMDIDKSGDEVKYLTKGDNNLYADAEKIGNSKIEGKVIANRRFMRVFFLIIRSRALTIFNTLLFIEIIIVIQRIRKREKRRRKLKEQYAKNKDL